MGPDGVFFGNGRFGLGGLLRGLLRLLLRPVEKIPELGAGGEGDQQGCTEQ